MKKSQSVMMYGVLTILLGIIILSSIIMLSGSIRKSSSKEMVVLISDTILAKAENRILEAKALGKFSNNEVKYIIELPNKIGGQEYSIVGGGKYLKIRVFGRDPVSRKRKIGSDIDTYGVSFPPEMQIIYNPITNSVTIK